MAQPGPRSESDWTSVWWSEESLLQKKSQQSDSDLIALKDVSTKYYFTGALKNNKDSIENVWKIFGEKVMAKKPTTVTELQWRTVDQNHARSVWETTDFLWLQTCWSHSSEDLWTFYWLVVVDIYRNRSCNLYLC